MPDGARAGMPSTLRGRHARLAASQNIIVVPLRVHGEVVGSLNLTRVGGPEAHFGEHEFELSKLFAGQASIALQNAETHVTVSSRADLDALTGLRNHGTFQRDLAAMIEAGAAVLAPDDGPRLVQELQRHLRPSRRRHPAPDRGQGDRQRHAPERPGLPLRRRRVRGDSSSGRGALRPRKWPAGSGWRSARARRTPPRAASACGSPFRSAPRTGRPTAAPRPRWWRPRMRTSLHGAKRGPERCASRLGTTGSARSGRAGEAARGRPRRAGWMPPGTSSARKRSRPRRRRWSAESRPSPEPRTSSWQSTTAPHEPWRRPGGDPGGRPRERLERRPVDQPEVAHPPGRERDVPRRIGDGPARDGEPWARVWQSGTPAIDETGDPAKVGLPLLVDGAVVGIIGFMAPSWTGRAVEPSGRGRPRGRPWGRRAEASDRLRGLSRARRPPVWATRRRGPYTPEMPALPQPQAPAATDGPTGYSDLVPFTEVGPQGSAPPAPDRPGDRRPDHGPRDRRLLASRRGRRGARQRHDQHSGSSVVAGSCRPERRRKRPGGLSTLRVAHRRGLERAGSAGPGGLVADARTAASEWSSICGPSLTFSNGSALTASDVVASWMRVLNPAHPSQLASLLDAVTGARAYREGTGPASAVGIHASGDSEVDVDLSSAAVDFPAIASSPTLAVVPPDIDSNPGVLSPGTFVGSGGYVLGAVTTTEITLTANSHYWAGKPAISTVHLITSLGSNSEVDEFEAGEPRLHPDRRARTAPGSRTTRPWGRRSAWSRRRRSSTTGSTPRRRPSRTSTCAAPSNSGSTGAASWRCSRTR